MFLSKPQSNLQCENTSDNIKNNTKHCNLKATFYQSGKNNLKFDKMIANNKKTSYVAFFLLKPSLGAAMLYMASHFVWEHPSKMSSPPLQMESWTKCLGTFIFLSFLRKCIFFSLSFIR